MADFGSENDDQKLISESWVVEVKKLLKGPEQNPVKMRGVTRLPQAMVNGSKAKAYTPQTVSLGPYHHQTLKAVPVASYHHRLSHVSPMEQYKLKLAREAVKGSSDSSLIEDLHKKISEQSMIAKFEQFYDWKFDQCEDFAWMMMVDALFLLQLLKKGFNSDAEHPLAMASIKCDIAKMENQIPLFLLEEVDAYVKIMNISDYTELGKVVPGRISRDLCSGFEVPQVPMENEEHLLGCMHARVSSFLQIQSKDEQQTKPTCWKKIRDKIDDMVAGVFSVFWLHPAKRGQSDFLDKYNARELAKAGIEFKSFPKNDPGAKIRFDRNSDTLFLPKIIISDTYTEVMLRNLLALEFINANSTEEQKRVTEYVELMDCLIDGAEDVQLLRKCGVIHRESLMITDDYVAKMWDGMYSPLFTGMLELPGGLKSQISEVLIKNYYKSKFKTLWTDYYQQYLSKPWRIIVLVTAICALLMDLTQTYCVFRECQSKSKGSAEKLVNHFG